MNGKFPMINRERAVISKLLIHYKTQENLIPILINLSSKCRKRLAMRTKSKKQGKEKKWIQCIKTEKQWIEMQDIDAMQKS